MIVTERYVKCDGGCIDEFEAAAWTHLSIPKQRTKLKKKGWHHVNGMDFCPDCFELYQDAQSGMNGLGKGWPKVKKKARPQPPRFSFGQKSETPKTEVKKEERRGRTFSPNSLQEIPATVIESSNGDVIQIRSDIVWRGGERDACTELRGLLEVARPVQSQLREDGKDVRVVLGTGEWSIDDAEKYIAANAHQKKSFPSG